MKQVRDLMQLVEEYVDMISAGIVDPVKVTRSALQNAASVASMVLTTESLVTDLLNRQLLPLRWIQVWECINLNNIKHRLQNAVCVLHMC